VADGISAKFGFWSFHKVLETQKNFDFTDFGCPSHNCFTNKDKKSIYSAEPKPDMCKIWYLCGDWHYIQSTVCWTNSKQISQEMCSTELLGTNQISGMTVTKCFYQGTIQCLHGIVAIGNPERHIRRASHCGSKQQ